MPSPAWLSRLSLLVIPVVLVACGGMPASRPVVTTAGSAPQEVCRGSEPSLAEVEALRNTHGIGEDLATMLRAERRVLEAARLRRASAPAADALFAEAEQDAGKRAAALERYAAAVEQAHLSATSAVRLLDDHCTIDRMFARSAKKPAPNARQKRLDCESLAQIHEGVRWDDAGSVRSLAESVQALGTLPPEGVRETASHARSLSAALRAGAADRAIFMARRDVAARAEQRASALLARCPAQPAHRPALVVAPEPNQRALTVIVAAMPPKGLSSRFESAALASTPEEAQLYRGIASGRYGSGFIVVVRGDNGARETFVVTNRHVADLASSVSVKIEGGASFDATPVFVDPGYDIAVLAPKDPAHALAPLGGFDLAARAPLDGQEVTATGYPGLLGGPSFQLSKGHVSNASVVFPEGKLVHVQHTAAIGAGSSGGPLLGTHREVLGVNTYKLVGREAVGIAVPADAVARAIMSARAGSRCDGPCKKKAAEDACLSLVSELARPEPNITAIQRMLGEGIIAEHGIASHNVLVDQDATFHARFKVSPVATLSEAVARRLVGDVREAGGIHSVETCSGMRAADIEKNTVAVSIALVDGRRDLTFSWDGSRWRLTEFPFDEEPEPEPPPAAPPPLPKKRAPAKAPAPAPAKAKAKAVKP